jgi:hypothetical protein
MLLGNLNGLDFDKSVWFGAFSFSIIRASGKLMTCCVPSAGNGYMQVPFNDLLLVKQKITCFKTPIIYLVLII